MDRGTTPPTAPASARTPDRPRSSSAMQLVQMGAPGSSPPATSSRSLPRLTSPPVGHGRASLTTAISPVAIMPPAMAARTPARVVASASAPHLAHSPPAPSAAHLAAVAPHLARNPLLSSLAARGAWSGSAGGDASAPLLSQPAAPAGTQSGTRPMETLVDSVPDLDVAPIRSTTSLVPRSQSAPKLATAAPGSGPPEYFLTMRASFAASTVRRIEPSVVAPEHFVKIKLLGKGDVGKVYLVRRKGTNKLYAAKVLSKAEMLKRNKIHRVLTEQEILTACNHPFLVTLYHTFQTSKNVYFVLEYCLGGEFYRALQKRPGRVLREHEARFYVAEVTLALEYLHLNSICYRDLKPENILMHASGHIKLTDFDLSKRAPRRPSFSTGFDGLNPNGNEWAWANGQPDTDAYARDFRTNSFVGTEEYLAPEVIRGEGHGVAVDWWTLGIFCYELLYGRTPFRSKNRNLTFANILRTDLSFPIAHNPISTTVRHFMRRLLAKSESKRLGAKQGAHEIKTHPWFKSLAWPLLRNMTPPMIPSRDKWDAIAAALPADDALDAELATEDADEIVPGGAGTRRGAAGYEIRSEDSHRASNFVQETFDPREIGLPAPTSSASAPTLAGAGGGGRTSGGSGGGGACAKLTSLFDKWCGPAVAGHDPVPDTPPPPTPLSSSPPNRTSSHLPRPPRAPASREGLRVVASTSSGGGNGRASSGSGHRVSGGAGRASAAKDAASAVPADPFAAFQSVTLLHGDDPLDEVIVGPDAVVPQESTSETVVEAVSPTHEVGPKDGRVRESVEVPSDPALEVMK
ncbi:hypothetical protein GGF31_000233 [Allomyces arbusculus]|nr:hypothetical protein GGF31_000233 [Allomyces arbusculus]